MPHNRAAHFLLLTVLVGATGCAGVNRIGTKMDMAAGRLGEPSKPEYEGKLTSIKKVGPMVALQFNDGQFYDVEEAPAGLVRGDVVRIYRNEKGYEAHLWHADDTEFQTTSSR